jgi:hypothetical protein
VDRRKTLRFLRGALQLRSENSSTATNTISREALNRVRHEWHKEFRGGEAEAVKKKKSKLWKSYRLTYFGNSSRAARDRGRSSLYGPGIRTWRRHSLQYTQPQPTHHTLGLRGRNTQLSARLLMYLLIRERAAKKGCAAMRKEIHKRHRPADFLVCQQRPTHIHEQRTWNKKGEEEAKEKRKKDKRNAKRAVNRAKTNKNTVTRQSTNTKRP